jgi:hypothetical protein
VAERLKAPVLKTGILQGIGGSNPSPSAMIFEGAARWPPAVLGPADEGVATHNSGLLSGSGRSKLRVTERSRCEAPGGAVRGWGAIRVLPVRP